MTRSRRILGRTGEEMAVRHLAALGYEIVERNVSLRVGEIDIVARDGPVYVLVEVRTRRGEAWGSALASVDAAKQRRLARAARAYMASRGLHDAAFRFDVVAITWNRAGSPPRIEHIQDAFTLS